MSVSSYDAYRFEINRVEVLIELDETMELSDSLGVALAHLLSDFHYQCETGQLRDDIGNKSAKLVVKSTGQSDYLIA